MVNINFNKIIDLSENSKILFVIIISLITYLITKLGNRIIFKLMEVKQIYIFEGRISKASPITVNTTYNPDDTSAVHIPLSNNEDGGIEFTWHIWLYVNDVPTYIDNNNGYVHIFHKGMANNSISNHDTFLANNTALVNCPGLYLQKPHDPSIDSTVPSNSLKFLIDTYSTPGNLLSLDLKTGTTSSAITIPNIPMRKWFFLTMRCMTTKWDIYINGILKQSVQLNNIPKQNHGSIFVNGGLPDKQSFDGDLSNLVYHPYALSPNEIMDIFQKGPNLELILKTASPDQDNYGSERNFLSGSWYY